MQKPYAICSYAHLLQTHQVCVFYHAYNKWKCLLAHISWCKIVMKHFESFVSVILLNKKKTFFDDASYCSTVYIKHKFVVLWNIQCTNYIFQCLYFKIIRNASVTSIDMLRQKVCNGRGYILQHLLGMVIKNSIRKNHFSVTLKMLN